MTVLVDSSAVLAFLNPRDDVHEPAVETMRELLRQREHMVMHSHALVETVALTQRRLGLEAVDKVVAVIQPMLEVVWLDQEAHDRAVAADLETGRDDVSLVDHASFQIMRERDIHRAFSFDRDFIEFGFETVPLR